MKLRYSQLKPGMVIYFAEKGSGARYKKAIVDKMCKYFCTVKVMPLSDDTEETYDYIESLGYTSIGCGDIIVKNKINDNELATKLDVAIED